MTQTRPFTEEEFVNEMRVAGFLGAYKFWTLLQRFDGEISDQARRDAAGILKGLAVLSLKLRAGQPLTAQEVEAFEYCLEELR